MVECSNDLLTKEIKKSVIGEKCSLASVSSESFLPQVKHANAAVSSNTGENIGGTMHKGDIVNILVVSNQLGFRLVRFDIPDCASRINTRSDNQGWIGHVPIKRS
jgi:hypothetical protein